MAETRVTVIPGDGIGPDIIDATLRLLDALDCDFAYDRAIAGQTALDQGKDLVPQETLDMIEKNPVALKGPITTPVGKGFRSVNVTLRKHFDLFANLRPALSIPGVRSRYDNVDILTIRENIEGIYSGEGQMVTDDGERAELRSVITRKESKRLIRFAYEAARRLGRRKVTVVHKANIMKSTSGLFLSVARSIAEEYPDIEHEEMIVDNCAMQLAMNPHRFDVLVTTNLFGDILSDLCAGLTGGLGLAPGANVGEHRGIFEAVHGSAPDIAGKGVANPISQILSAAMMLEHLSETTTAQMVNDAVWQALTSQDVVIQSNGQPRGGTKAVTEGILAHLS